MSMPAMPAGGRSAEDVVDGARHEWRSDVARLMPVITRRGGKGLRDRVSFGIASTLEDARRFVELAATLRHSRGWRRATSPSIPSRAA